MTRSRSPRATWWRVLSLSVAAACLPGCATPKTAPQGSAAVTPPAPRSNIPDAAQSSSGSPTASISATDPCATRLHDLCGPLLHYYALNRRLPERLDELQTLAGADPAVSFDCPVSGQPYVYVPGGFRWGDKPGFVVLHDAEPSHSGFRWAVVVEEPRGAQPLITRVVAVPEPLFLSPGRTRDGDSGQD